MSVGMLRQSPGGRRLRSGRRRGSEMQREGKLHKTLLGGLQLFLAQTSEHITVCRRPWAPPFFWHCVG